MSFKDMVARDVKRVFLNTREFAENRTVRYDGKEYPDIPVVLEGPVQEKRSRLTDDHVRGLHLVTATLYCALEDVGGKVPKQGSSLEIATKERGRFFQRYYIVASTSYMGMLQMELEAVAQ